MRKLSDPYQRLARRPFSKTYIPLSMCRIARFLRTGPEYGPSESIEKHNIKNQKNEKVQERIQLQIDF